MEKDIRLLHEALQSGRCCAQALIEVGLKLKGEENEQLVLAAGALCLGIRSGHICGALSGAAEMMMLFDPELAVKEWIPELSRWFEETYTEAYGGANCNDILGGVLANKAVRCPAVVENTYRKVRELLEDDGIDLEEMLGE